MSYGAQVNFGIARQAAEGAAARVVTVGSFHALPFVNHDIGLEKDELISENLIGRFEQGAVYDGQSSVAGTLEFEATPRNLMAVAAAVLTHSPSIVTSGSVKTMTFQPGASDYSSTLVKAPYTIYSQFADAMSADLFYDCQFSQLELTVSAGQFTRGRATVVGGARYPTGIGSLNVMPDPADAGRLWPWNVASISLGGAGVSNFSDITVSINENIEPLTTINGTLSPYKYTRGGFREVTVSGTMYMSDRTQLNDFVAGTLKRLLVFAANSLTSIQSGFYNSMLIDIPQLKITAFKPPVTGPGEVSVNFQARGVIDPTSSYAFQLTLTNTYGAAL